MRSPHWEYLGYVFVGVGVAFLITGSFTFSFQKTLIVNSRYSLYPILLMIAGISMIILGILSFMRSRTVRRNEAPLPPPFAYTIYSCFVAVDKLSV